MKTTKILSILACSLLTTSSFAQNWLVDGNNNGQLGGSLTPSIGTNGNRPLLLETNGLERFQITPFGSFQWFGSNATGLRSMALGNATTASGENSFSGGLNSQATNFNSFSFGRYNESTAEYAVSFGWNNEASACTNLC